MSALSYNILTISQWHGPSLQWPKIFRCLISWHLSGFRSIRCLTGDISLDVHWIHSTILKGDVGSSQSSFMQISLFHLAFNLFKVCSPIYLNSWIRRTILVALLLNSWIKSTTLEVLLLENGTRFIWWVSCSKAFPSTVEEDELGRSVEEPERKQKLSLWGLWGLGKAFQNEETWFGGGGLLPFPTLLKDMNWKERPLFPQCCFTVQVPMPLWTWILLKVHSLWLGVICSVLLCFLVAGLMLWRMYAAQVKCVTQRALTELIPIGCTHLSPFNQWRHNIWGSLYI